MKMDMKIRRHKRFQYKSELKAGLVIIAVALLAFLCVYLYQNRQLPIVTFAVSDAEIRESEEIPAFSVNVTCDTEKNIVLDKNTGYSLEDLKNDVASGNGYVIEHEANAKKEGSYTITLKLNEEWNEKFQSNWSKKIELNIQNGNLNVKNKYGDWEGKKFRLVDGAYALGWLNISDNTYYFDESNTYVTGEYVIGETTYYFGEDGKFDKEKNKINPNNPMVALTFDDGPGPYTLKLLEGLEANQAKATFFMLGSRAGVYPETVKRMVEIGCEVGNHSKTHVQLTQVSNAVVQAEISETNAAILNASGISPGYLRPPYGSSDNRVRAIANMPVVLWSVDTLDWKSKDVEQIKQAIRSTIKDGDIVLMHDIYQTTVDAILQLIPELKAQGYQFVTVSELAANRGVTLKSGEIYRYFYK